MSFRNRIEKEGPFLSSFLPSLITIKDQRQMLVEQPYQLVSFSETHITLKSVQGMIQIKGKGLTIVRMQQEEMVIEGNIDSLLFNK